MALCICYDCKTRWWEATKKKLLPNFLGSLTEWKNMMKRAERELVLEPLVRAGSLHTEPVQFCTGCLTLSFLKLQHSKQLQSLRWRSWWLSWLRGCRGCRGCDCDRRGPGRYLMATRSARCLDLWGGKRLVAELMPTTRQSFNRLESLSIGGPKIQRDLLKSTFPKDFQNITPWI